MAAAGTGERRELPDAFLVEDSRGRGFVRLGRAELQTDRERKSAGRSRLYRRSGKAYHSAVGAGGAAGGLERRGWRAGDVPDQPGRVHAGSFAGAAGGRFEGGAL